MVVRVELKSIKLCLFSGTGISGNSGSNRGSSSNKGKRWVMLNLRWMMRLKMFQMDNYVWYVWWGEGVLSSFPVGILCVAKGVPYQLNVKLHPNVLFVVRRFEIQCGLMNLEQTQTDFSVHSAAGNFYDCYWEECLFFTISIRSGIWSFRENLPLLLFPVNLLLYLV